ncbi:hypothetical protein N3K66_004398 [Trichothecium roseum]|uniref:Uncharacterized protein n=1 Tax=Trichothecium roseum TaxID=47278 RepID=A0ACC0V2X9_9HYPO|nr:hypothetical protein N3K66_004398 [Trichothecium roseum]
MASKHRLRRSCAFCRARKIKCSNETICEACNRQGADCIYDFEPPRPKARASLEPSTRSDSLSMRNGDLASLMSRQRSSTGGSIRDSPIVPIADDFSAPEDGEDIASALERAFFDNWAPSGLHNRSQGRRLPEGMVTKFGQRSIRNSSMLSLLTHDLVGVTTSQLSGLGCCHVDNGEASFFFSGLEHDDTPSMFDSHAPSVNPINDDNKRQRTQLIDVWYSSHPLSFLVSKTLLLRELRDGTHDEVLLAVMLADANFTIGGEAATARGQGLINWAAAQLRNRPLQIQSTTVMTDSGTVVYSGISTRIFNGLATAQALMLLGWNALGASQFRRAINYIELAGKMAADLKEQVVSLDGMQLSSRINGIDVYDVEKELIDYLYWATYSMCLWVYTQTGRDHFAGRAPTVQTPVFIPINDDGSAAMQLDLVSENLSTLQKQRSAVREMWPMAHVAIAIAHSCGFHPQHVGKQYNPLQLAHDTNFFLMESIHELNAQTSDVSAISYALVVYHTLAIQCLFPPRSDDSMFANVVERLCYSIEELLQIFAVASAQPTEAFPVTPTPRSGLPSAFGLAFDSCARALRSIDNRRQTDNIMAQCPSLQIYMPNLETLCSRLYLATKHDFLEQKSTLRTVRKQLKVTMRSFGSRGSTSTQTADLSDPESNALSPTQGESEHLSTATTPEVDHSSVFVSPKESSVATLSPEPLDTPQHGHLFNPADITNMPRSHPQPMKAQWHSRAGTATGEEMFAMHPMNANALGIQSREELSLSGMVGLQHTWLPQMPPMMDYDANGQPWNMNDMKVETGVPTAIWSEMDMAL